MYDFLIQESIFPDIKANQHPLQYFDSVFTYIYNPIAGKSM